MIEHRNVLIVDNYAAGQPVDYKLVLTDQVTGETNIVHADGFSKALDIARSWVNAPPPSDPLALLMREWYGANE